MMNAQNPRATIAGPGVVSGQDVEVVYALPEHQVVVTIPWKTGLTLEVAVRESGLLERFTEYELAEGRVGVYGLRQPLDYRLEPGDRVELYRPLAMSPNDSRLRRADRSGR